jgi:hypothetical protein
MDASQLMYPEIVHSGPKYECCTFYESKVSEMLWSTRKHHFGSNGLEWMLHNFVIRNIAFGPETRVFHLLPAEGLRNAPKHFHTSFWVQWTWMGASQLWYPEIVQLGSNTSFEAFYVLKVSEIIRNTRKHNFGSNGLEWMLHIFGTPK